MRETIVADSNSYGIYGQGAVDGTYLISVTNSTIQDNGYAGFYILDQNNTVVTVSAITGHSGYGVYNGDLTTVIMAENNWWGDASGPDPYGTGNGINYSGTDYYVDADPWLTTAPPMPLSLEKVALDPRAIVL
jgi:hypothetical protein